MIGMAHPFVAERLAEAHRDDLLRSAEAWRLAHAVTMETAAHRSSTVLTRLHEAVRLPRPAVLAHRRRRETLCACPCPPQR
jgi:hypothetical protein